MTWITEDIDPALSPNEPADDGFMFMSYWESSQASGIMNTYFTIPTLQRPAGAQMIEVSLTQCYRKYYDQCFIDYNVGGHWYAREINVTGIDMGVNDWAANKVRYVLPHALNSEQNIQLRIRAYSYHRGNVFGYFWAVDNVAVMALTLNEYWALNSPTNIDGFYGVMPQGMTVPMTYGVNAQNLSTSDITNAHATLSAGTSRNSLTSVLTGPNVTVPQGDLDNIVPVIINERGFFVEGEDAASGYQSWPSDGTNTTPVSWVAVSPSPPLVRTTTTSTSPVATSRAPTILFSTMSPPCRSSPPPTVKAVIAGLTTTASSPVVPPSRWLSPTGMLKAMPM